MDQKNAIARQDLQGMLRMAIPKPVSRSQALLIFANLAMIAGNAIGALTPFEAMSVCIAQAAAIGLFHGAKAAARSLTRHASDYGLGNGFAPEEGRGPDTTEIADDTLKIIALLYTLMGIIFFWIFLAFCASAVFLFFGQDVAAWQGVFLSPKILAFAAPFALAHALSFADNYIGRKEYLAANKFRLASSLPKRFAPPFAVLAIGMAVIGYAPAFPFAVFLIVKGAVDVLMHGIERRDFAAKQELAAQKEIADK
ncbi:MAG: DUF6498-containing protein [Candidatus Micrarchaeia archaeon]